MRMRSPDWPRRRFPIRRKGEGKMRTWAVSVLASVMAWTAAAPVSAAVGTCISGGCHKAISSFAYLHGPVAAEETGKGEGCASCHVPTGSPCTATKGGKYVFKTKEERLCLLCHERGTGTKHTAAKTKCLSCHSPHGSKSGYTLMRAGR